MHGTFFTHLRKRLVDSSITDNPRFDRNFRSYVLIIVQQGESKKGNGSVRAHQVTIYTHKRVETDDWITQLMS